MRADQQDKQMPNARKIIYPVQISPNDKLGNEGVPPQRKRFSPEALKVTGLNSTCESPNGEKRSVNSSLSFHHNNHNPEVTMVSGGSPDPLLQRKELWSRKYIARRNLMGHLYSRQPPMKRSYSFVAGEKPPNESVFPQLQRKQGSADKSGRQKSENARKVRRNDESGNSSKKCEKIIGSGDRNIVHRSGTESKISLPELINDINMSARMKSPGTESASSDELHEGEIEDTDGLQIHTGKYRMFKYRPITPGLIDKLNKLRLSSRCRTEQWINALPIDHCHSSTILENYREIRPLDNSVKQPAQEWIYSD